jgi:hypothetical protein
MDGFKALTTGWFFFLQFGLDLDEILGQWLFNLLAFNKPFSCFPLNQIPETNCLFFNEFGKPGIWLFSLTQMGISQLNESFFTFSDLILDHFIGAIVIEVKFFFNLIHLKIIKNVTRCLMSKQLWSKLFLMFSS